MSSVNSNLNTHILYKKPKVKIYKNDKGKKATVYKILLTDEKIPVIIALGESRKEHLKYNILYCPVYLVLGDGINNKITFDNIGVYEFFASKEEDLKDDFNDYNIRIIEGPLIFNDITNKKLKKMLNDKPLLKDIEESEIEEEEDKEAEESKIDKTGESIAVMAKPLLVSLELEDDDDVEVKDENNEKDYRKIVKEYEAMGVNAPRKNWLQKKFHDYNYKIWSNKGSGDCFFIALSQAYKSIGKKASDKELRQKLATNIPESTYKEYMDRKKMFENFLEKTQQSQLDIKKKVGEMKKMKSNKQKQFDEIKKSIGQKSIKQDPRYKEIVALNKEMQKLVKLFGEKKKEFSQTQQHLAEFSFMNDVKSLEQFKNKIKMSDYWADDSSLRIMEEVLNIKIVVIDKENKNGLIRCTDASDSIKAKGFFKPKYFVIMDLDQGKINQPHYQLVSYKNRKMFRFHELPHSVKEEIKHTCLLGSGNGIYNFIPKFNKLLKEKEDSSNDEEDTIATIDAAAEEQDNLEFKDYDEDVVFVFYSKSAHKKPGKGQHEKIPKEKEIDYKELTKEKDWRKVLSNFYIVSNPFELDGHTWNSVEHYYQASKFQDYTEKSEKHDFYLKFTAESGSEISKDPAKAKKYGGKDKSGKYRKKHILMDDDFFNGKHKISMERAQRAKYTTDNYSQKILLLTKNAKLVHLEKVRGGPSKLITFYDTMKIRKELNNK